MGRAEINSFTHLLYMFLKQSLFIKNFWIKMHDTVYPGNLLCSFNSTMCWERIQIKEDTIENPVYAMSKFLTIKV